VPFDAPGLVLLVLFVGAMQIMVDKGKDLDWFSSPEITILAVVSAVSFLFFLAWELTDRHPIVDLRLFGERNFLAGTLSLSVAYGLFFGNVVLLPLWLQQYMGYTATWAGLATAPVGLLAIVLSPWVGANVRRFDPRLLASVAFVGFGAVLWMRSQFNTQADFTTILIPTVLQGAAMAFFFIPLQAVVFAGLTPDRMPSAAGLSNFVRITAGAVGTSLFTTLWEDRARLHHARLSEAVNRGNDAAVRALDQLTAGGMSHAQALAFINRTLDQQAYTLAVTDVFYLSAVLFFVLVAVIWLADLKPGATMGGGTAH
jgi:DHA2 family multidrug resistance protein